MVCKVYGTMLGFVEVKEEKDWRIPNGGAPKGWRSKVNYDVIKEFDQLIGDETVTLPGANAELRRRLKDQALPRKHFSGASENK